MRQRPVAVENDRFLIGGERRDFAV